MHRLYEFKRGVSPLIATILLIAFAVALGSVILQWLGTFPFEDKCRNVQISLKQEDGAGLCYGGVGQNSYLNFGVRNTGSIDVDGFSIWVEGESSTKLLDFENIKVLKGSLYEKTDKVGAFDSSALGKIRKAHYIPKIKTEQAREICPRNAVKIEDIKACD